MTDTNELPITAVLWGDPDGSVLLKVPNPTSTIVSDLRPLAAANFLGNVPLPTLNRLKLYDISAENVRISDSRLRENGLTVTEVFPNAVLLDPFQLVTDAFPNTSNGRTIQLVIVSPPEDPAALLSPPPYEPGAVHNNALDVPDPTRTAVLVKNGVPREDVPSWEGTAAAILPTLPSTPKVEDVPPANGMARRSTVDMLNEKLGYFGRQSQEYDHVGAEDPERGSQASGSVHKGDVSHTGAAFGVAGLAAGGNFHSDASTSADPNAAGRVATNSSGLPRLSAEDRPKHYVTVAEGRRKKFLGSKRRKIACCVIILLLLALSVGLGTGLSKRSEDPSQPPSPPDPSNDPTAPLPPTSSSNPSPSGSPNGSPTGSPGDSTNSSPAIPAVTASVKTVTLPNSGDSIRDVTLDLSRNTIFASYGTSVLEWKTDDWSTTLHEAESGAATGGSIVGNIAVEETVVMSAGPDGTIRTWEIGKSGGPMQYRWPASTGGANRVEVAPLGTLSHPVFGNSLGLFRCLDEGSTPLTTSSTNSPRHNLKSIVKESSVSLFVHGGAQSYGYLEHWEFPSKPATTANQISNVTITPSSSSAQAPSATSAKSMDISPDTKFAIISFNPGPTLQIEISSGKQLAEFQFASRSMDTTALAISKDGKYLFTAHDVEGGSTIVQWDIGNRSQVKKFYGHKRSVVRLVASNDGKYLYSADNGEIQQWNLA